MRAFLSLMKRDLLLAFRRSSEVFTVIFFFLVVVSLFPMAKLFDHKELAKLAPTVVWVAALLSSILSMNRLFSQDFEDASLEQLMMSSQPLSLFVLAKILVHWLLTGLPLIVIAPIVGLWYHMPMDSVMVLVLSILVGTPILSFIGAIPAALTLGLNAGGALLSLILLPLYIPVMVYGSGAVSASMYTNLGDGHLAAYFYILLAFLILSIVFVPLLVAAALRVSTE